MISKIDLFRERRIAGIGVGKIAYDISLSDTDDDYYLQDSSPVLFGLTGEE